MFWAKTKATGLSVPLGMMASALSDMLFAGGRTFFNVTVLLPSSRSTGERRSTSIMRAMKSPYSSLVLALESSSPSPS